MSKMVLIEYVEDHDAFAGLESEDEKAFTIEAGTQRRVDAASAASLVKKGKAKLVEVDAPSEPAESADPDDDEADDDPDETAADPAVTTSSTWPSSGAN
jgi:hypothetical protein